MAQAGSLNLGYRSVWGGIAAIFIGATALIDYAFDLPIPLIIDVVPGGHPPIGSGRALCLCFAGLALCLRALRAEWRSIGHLFAAVVLVLALANLGEYVLASATGSAASGAGADSGWLAPLVPLEAAAFLVFFSISYFLSNRRVGPAVLPWLRLSMGAQIVLAIWALAGQLLSLGDVYPGGLMAQLSALGCASLAWATYEARQGVCAEDTLSEQLREERIVTLAMLGALVLAGGALLTGFDLVQWFEQRQLVGDANRYLAEDSQLVASEIEAATKRGKLVATRPRTLELLSEAAHPSRLDWHEGLNAIARSYLPIGYSAIAFLDAQKRVVAGAGTFRGATSLSVPIAGTSPTRLLWDGRLYIQIDDAVLDNDQVVGHAVTQQPLERLTRLLQSGAQRGSTGEILLCSSDTSTVHCFPSRFRDAPFAVAPRAAPDSDPIELAFQGRKGVGKLIDYRDRRVLAAYAPLGPSRLVVVSKMDLAEAYQPLAQAFSLSLLALALLIALSNVFTRFSIWPLVEALALDRNLAGASELRFRTIAEGSLDALFTVKSQRDESGEIIDFVFTFVNLQGETLLGRQRELILGQTLCDLLPWARATGWYERCKKAVDTEQGVDADLQADFPGAPASWVQMHAIPLEDGLSIEIRGISERKSAQKRLRQLAPIDPITELPNRPLFLDRLERSMIRTRRRRGVLAVMDIDIDRFTAVNDRHGHATGDYLLRSCAKRLTQSLRAEDSVARLGGDEFAIILEGLHDRREAVRAADAVLTALRRDFPLPGGTLHITSSIGIAFFNGESGTPESMLKRASAARGEVSRRGGDGYLLAEGSVDDGEHELSGDDKSPTSTASEA